MVIKLIGAFLAEIGFGILFNIHGPFFGFSPCKKQHRLTRMLDSILNG